MSMVFCRGCAKEISSLAVACPQCGAPQVFQPTRTTSNAVPETGNPYLEVLKKYAVFTGRASRREYWMFILINLGVAIVLGVIDAVLGAKGIISNFYSLAVFLPSIAAAIRRMHDTNRSGWWILLPIVNIVFLAQDSQPGDNRFGPNPKGIN
ncbi:MULTISPECIES: DUF805 domain-containing protein [unclassified Pseudomonas]|uniref:DUF805 domain-containing protein n=1 Tax=unclassified Pseudomonas TaxID=196821 RepID=UPI00191267E7|nr:MULTISPECIES: DUF805 domain-containing protein [unclassified Pseudomonas]MBK5549174.1 DUF805 domain-containing protein [Pseudomonas sp. TH03]MEB0227331.1 DUF805 domain-containing protein [Pseudomonas sp. 5S1]MEB0297455.1 DUF805 domain-containing protein [Pseudomonas sp. 10S4]WPX17397.1 DUF805 domain-containing protein [Pseudomonas sp. 10S4]